MNKRLNWWTRKLHRWGAILVALPMLVVVCTGLLLQVKKQVAWVQPPTQSGSAAAETWIALDDILRASRTVPEAEIETWEHIERLDIQPGKGIVKVQASNRWELQLDLGTGEILSSAHRRSDLIESLHDGSWFSERAKLWVFLPNGAILLGLWMTGMYLWFLPIIQKRANRRRRAEAPRPSAKTV